MNRALVVLAVLVVLLGGGVATTGSFTDGDEVATDSGVYLSPADSENADRYVAYDGAGELRLRFGSVPPDARTSVDDLFLVGFAGYEGDDSATTVEIDADAEGVTLYRMDTGERVTGGEITLEPEASVTLGATVPPTVGSYTESVRFTVDVPEDDTGSDPGDGTGGGTGGPSDSGDDGGGPDDSGNGDGGPADSGDGDGTGGNDGGTGSGSGGDSAGDGDSGTGSDGGDDGTGDDGTGDDGTSGSGSGTDGGDSGTGGDADSGADGGDGGSDGTDGDSDAGDGTDDGEADGTANDVSDSAEGDPTAEPAGGQFELLPVEWSLFAGFLAGLSNYLVQTRIKDVVPALKTERSERRARLRSILVREAVITLAVIALTVLVASVLSSAGVTGTPQLVATLAFSAVVGGVSGVRGFPRI
ncbi:hypothetical protein PM076_06850 [Halorubrum ezzemoulense]|uniref:Uncharacterized protein n=1 Tax=Halorubrum ezzemoulense TaxID=337243 RepID=A0ABT4YYX3_HALEZ|nr:hypothetical protein [Halorubrum ezzemoulense]MDB2243195.1 hypothetical protein [Halorubrum ezzemoulense]MDB2251266.1 hypothetical protein [Halorubrum ezzemoulense]MDB2276930.1 hypothetical protein [Halorubrum ezzemoulense]MDB2286626.1 hypothetical protein [Halorubrum ezzemoulense]MDB2288557.1 hypothetical protein [Halorubrum ezzemoulense]